MDWQATGRVIWERARSIPDRPGSWGRFLSCVMASAWAVSLMFDHSPALISMKGTSQLISIAGTTTAALWMVGVASFPIAAYLTDSNILRVIGAVIGLGTWSPLFLIMILTGHLAHLSAGTCVVGILACLRADYGLLDRLIIKRIRV